MLNREQKIKECEQIIEHLDRIRQLKDTIANRLLKTGQYGETYKKLYEIMERVIDLEYEVEKYKDNLESEDE